MCVFTDLAAAIPTRPIWGVKKAVGVKEVQLSPKVPSRDTEPGPLTIPHVLTPASRHALGQPLLTTVSLSWPGRNSKTIPLYFTGETKVQAEELIGPQAPPFLKSTFNCGIVLDFQ